MDIAKTLAGGDRRSIGKADAVAAHVLAHEHALGAVIAGLRHDDAVVRMRCADVAEKVSAKRPEWMQPFAAELLDISEQSSQQEVRWHMAQMLPRLALAAPERRRAVATLFDYLDDRSRIVQAFAMTALADLAQQDASLRKRFVPMIEEMVRSGSAAVKNRGRKLLDRLT